MSCVQGVVVVSTNDSACRLFASSGKPLFIMIIRKFDEVYLQPQKLCQRLRIRRQRCLYVRNVSVTAATAGKHRRDNADLARKVGCGRRCCQVNPVIEMLRSGLHNLCHGLNTWEASEDILRLRLRQTKRVSSGCGALSTGNGWRGSSVTSKK